MYKITIAGIIATMLMIGTAMAIPQPCPISLWIKTVPQESAYGLTVAIKDNGNIIGQGTTIQNGQYGEVVIDIGSSIVQCGSFQATIIQCQDNPACTKTVSSNPQGFTVWDVSAVPMPCVCPTCDICPTDITPYAECNSCCKNDSNIDTIVAGLVALIVGAGGGILAIYVKNGKLKLSKAVIDKIISIMPNGSGLKIAKSYSGGGSLKHWHRSPKAYHDMAQRHKALYDHEGDKNLFPDFKS